MIYGSTWLVCHGLTHVKSPGVYVIVKELLFPVGCKVLMHTCSIVTLFNPSLRDIRKESWDFKSLSHHVFCCKICLSFSRTCMWELIFSFISINENIHWLLVWQGETTTDLTAESKPLHLQQMIPSNSKQDLRPWHLNPLLRFLFFILGRGLGGGREMREQTHATSALLRFPPDVRAHLWERSTFSPGFKGRRFWEPEILNG